MRIPTVSACPNLTFVDFLLRVLLVLSLLRADEKKVQCLTNSTIFHANQKRIDLAASDNRQE